MKRPATAVAVVCALGIGLRAQQPQGAQCNPTKAPGTILKNKAPVSKDVLKVSLPKAAR